MASVKRKRVSAPVGGFKRQKTGKTRLSFVAAKIQQASTSTGVVASANELKVIDTAEASFACDTTGSVTSLNLCATGDDITNRDGRVINLHSVELRGIVSPSDLGTNPTLARVMLVYDTQPTVGLGTIAGILNAATSSAFNNLSNRNRFRVIRQWLFPCGAVSNTATQSFAQGPSVHHLNEWVSLKGLKSQFNAATGNQADISYGQLLLVTIGNQAAGSGAVFFGSARVRFSD